MKVADNSGKWSLFLLSIGLFITTLSAVPSVSNQAWMLFIGVSLAILGGLLIARKKK